VRTITKVLCAIDLTKASHNAFDRALSIARVSKARLYILHAVPTNYRFSWHQSERLELLTSLRQRAEPRSSGTDSRATRRSSQHDRAACQFEEGRSRRPWIQPATRLAAVPTGIRRRTCAAPRSVASVDRPVGRSLAKAQLRNVERFVDAAAACSKRGSRIFARSTHRLMAKATPTWHAVRRKCSWSS
jgi:hypothetical protein